MPPCFPWPVTINACADGSNAWAIQKQMREMDGKAKESTNTTIDKAIFVGSTSELSKLLKGKL